MIKKQQFKRRVSWLSSSLWTFTIAYFVTVSTVFAQEAKTIEGTISAASDGMPLFGVNILVKGSTVGTVSDFDGNYAIEAKDNATLIISYLGFQTQEIPINGRTTIDIQLTEDSAKLDEVVVIGYGSQKRSDISGSVSQVEQKEIARNPTPNLSNALVGQATGIVATQRSGEPGRDGSNIYIRGIGTTGDASPIYVIDGIVRSARDFSQLNANEIESFSVLKDAASAAVFGMRAGNGVILVTTKRGRAGRMQIDFSTTLGIQERTRDPEYLNSYEYAQLYNEALINQGDEPIYSEEDLQKYQNGSSPDTHPDADWFSVLNKTPLVKTHNISASGGSEKVQYAASFGALDQDGVIPEDNFKRYNFRSNIDAAVTNTTKLSFDISGRDEKINSIADPEVFRWLSSAPPNKTPIKFSNGGYSSGPAYLALPENGYRKEDNQVFKGRIQIEQQLPVDGLSFKAIGSYDKTITDKKNWKFLKTPFYTLAGDGSFVEQPSGADAASSLYQDHNDYQSVTFQGHLNYNTQIGNSNLSALVLYTQTKETWNFMSANRDGYTLAIDELDFGGTANRNNRGYSGTSGRQGVVGRLNWAFNEKYILEGSFRADGSEQFAPGKRWGFFPSGSLAYVISKESFLENSETIDLLKFRASYGVLGNDRIGGQRFLYLQSYNVNGTAVFGDGDVQQAIIEGNLANTNVTWETVKKLNIGLDATLWNGGLTMAVDYFSDKRSDILGSRNLTVPGLLGVGLPVENLAKVNNSGFEIELGHINRINEDWRYSMNANLTYAKNKIVFIDEPETDNANIRRTGLPLGTQFGLQALGIFQTQEEVDNAPEHFADTAPGDIRFADINGPDGVPDGKIDDFDRTAIGTSNTPEIIFGYRGNLQYKDFELSFLLQGATNVNQYYSGEGAWPFFLGTSGAFKQNLDRWTPTNTDASEPRVLINATNNQRGSSFWLKDASYLRLKNVEFAYNIPMEKLNQNFIKGIRLYVNANNVATWSKIDNYDPENDQGRGWGYPQLRIWNFGLNVNF
ncbi:TonB-linked outer membrane protein, SusC/RagA family [Maribacter sedimenticola]|uniref:TonB-linked outer membrane protein, SusC/RagA family n=1 Tax=Maribacter sedimenticola TaxID=228956 RepID=A0ABY1SEF1_9FLAO|nr:TonB-dependent receptor [Maribacter sedimenticola]SNR31289.1 TonB-linked outer membrane protein, SusC/RagA family [Maribacter sedimenticola]